MSVAKTMSLTLLFDIASPIDGKERTDRETAQDPLTKDTTTGNNLRYTEVTANSFSTLFRQPKYCEYLFVVL